MDKYRGCETAEQRDAAVRKDLASAGRGDFAAVADFLMALKYEDDAFLQHVADDPPPSGTANRKPQPQGADGADQADQHQPEEGDDNHGEGQGDTDSGKEDDELVRLPRRQQQRNNSHSTGRQTGQGAARRAAKYSGIPAALSSRIQFDFSLAPEFRQLFSLTDDIADAADARAGSAFLQALLVQNPSTRTQTMLRLLDSFVEEHGRPPRTHEMWEGERLGLWCASCKRLYRQGQLDAQLTVRLAAVPNWDWGQEQTEHCTEHQWLQLLRDFQQQQQRIPKVEELQDGYPVGRCCSRCKQQQKEGKLSQFLLAELPKVQGWGWGKPKASFDAQLQQVQQFAQQHRRFPVKRDGTLGKQLAGFLANMRSKKRKGRLSATQMQQVEDAFQGLDVHKPWTWGKVRAGLS